MMVAHHSIDGSKAALPEPSFSTFETWEDFDVHLALLERMLPQLHSIDRVVARIIKSSF